MQKSEVVGQAVWQKPDLEASCQFVDISAPVVRSLVGFVDFTLALPGWVDGEILLQNILLQFSRWQFFVLRVTILDMVQGYNCPYIVSWWLESAT